MISEAVVQPGLSNCEDIRTIDKLYMLEIKNIINNAPGIMTKQCER